MAAPILTLTDNSNSPLPLLNLGVIDAGTVGNPVLIRIWNNKANATNISDAINPQITVLTLNGYTSADSIIDGKEVVENQYIQIQNTSAGQTAYSSIGGTNTVSISDSAPQPGNSPPPPIIHSNNYATLLIRANVPATATAANISCLLSVSYQYQ